MYLVKIVYLIYIPGCYIYCYI